MQDAEMLMNELIEFVHDKRKLDGKFISRAIQYLKNDPFSELKYYIITYEEVMRLSQQHTKAINLKINMSIKQLKNISNRNGLDFIKDIFQRSDYIDFKIDSKLFGYLLRTKEVFNYDDVIAYKYYCDIHKYYNMVHIPMQTSGTLSTHNDSMEPETYQSLTFYLYKNMHGLTNDKYDILIKTCEDKNSSELTCDIPTFERFKKFVTSHPELLIEYKVSPIL